MGTGTETYADVGAGPRGWAKSLAVRGYSVHVVDGAPDQAFNAQGERCTVGSHGSNDLVIDHETVSRFHCVIEVDESGARAVDRQSKNGTIVDGVRTADAHLRDGSTLSLGAVTVRFNYGTEPMTLPLHPEEHLGELVGRSAAMRRAFHLLVRYAASDETVLLLGETGTGKEGAARAVHEHSKRKDGPFVVVDCGALPRNLMESELFGHTRGSFTGAHEDRVGAFAAADGGTVFLDEIGELPLDLQPKLLRVLEQRTVRPVGSHDRVEIDVRVIAATHRSLDIAVNDGFFRSDLFFRIAVLQVELPPLRERPGDLPVLAAALLEREGVEEEERLRILSPDRLAHIQSSTWRGNVRELRNFLNRARLLEGPEDAVEVVDAVVEVLPAAELSLSWSDARTRAIHRFERAYLTALLDKHDDNVTEAARATGLDRVYLHRLLKRHGMR